MPLQDKPMSISIPHITGLVPPTSSEKSGGSSNSLAAHSSANRRPRSGSLVEVKELPVNDEDALDQSAYRNVNPEWVNAKGL